VGVKPALFTKLHVRTDHAVRTNLATGTDLRAGINHRRGMNRGSHFRLAHAGSRRNLRRSPASTTCAMSSMRQFPFHNAFEPILDGEALPTGYGLQPGGKTRIQINH